jgi:hypothetical protein
LRTLPKNKIKRNKLRISDSKKHTYGEKKNNENGGNNSFQPFKHKTTYLK